MKLNSYTTVQITLDESEKETMEQAYEIMRKIKNVFLTSKLPEHQKQLEDALSILADICHGKEISE